MPFDSAAAVSAAGGAVGSGTKRSSLSGRKLSSVEEKPAPAGEAAAEQEQKPQVCVHLAEACTDLAACATRSDCAFRVHVRHSFNACRVLCCMRPVFIVFVPSQETHAAGGGMSIARASESQEPQIMPWKNEEEGGN